MPAERVPASSGPRSLEFLYSKYSQDKSFRSSSPFSLNKPTPSSTPPVPPVRRSRRRRPPPVVHGQELGDLRKLGDELSQVERVRFLLDMPTTARSKTPGKGLGPPSDASVHPSLLSAFCSQCSPQTVQEQKHLEGQTKLKDMKSKLRLVAPRSLPDHEAVDKGADHDTKPSCTMRHLGQASVSLPLLQLHLQCQDSASRKMARVREARQTLHRMLFPRPHRSLAAVWNWRPAGGSQPIGSRERMESSDASSRFLTSAGFPLSSDLDDQRGSETISTYDADRVDSQQFDYVFDRFSSLSTESDYCTTLTPDSHTATFSARAQRPSTTDTLVTQQLHRSQSRCSVPPPLSPWHKMRASRGSTPLTPVTPRQRARLSRESWPPKYTVVPTWPALDDPFRFQYLGRGVHRDIMRRLHKSRASRQHGQPGGRGNGSIEQQQQQPPPPPPAQKLEIVVPLHMECDMCRTYECEHTTPRQAQTTARSTARSLDALSANTTASVSRTDRASMGKPCTERVTGDKDVSWRVDKPCATQASDVTFDRGHYTVQKA